MLTPEAMATQLCVAKREVRVIGTEEGQKEIRTVTISNELACLIAVELFKRQREVRKAA